MQIWKLCVQVALAGAELCLGHLTSVSSPVLANKYHWPSADMSYLGKNPPEKS